MSIVFAWFSIIVAMIALALGYGLGSVWIGVGFTLTLGLLWLLGRWRGWGWMVPPAFVLLVGMAAVGLWLGLGAGWMLVGVVAALSAWDLEYFARRLQTAGRAEQAVALERVHLRRLLAVNAAGLALGAIALGIHIRLGFGLMLVLALVAVWGLSRAVRFLQQEED